MNGGIRLSQASNRATAGAASVASHSLLRRGQKMKRRKITLSAYLIALRIFGSQACQSKASYGVIVAFLFSVSK